MEAEFRILTTALDDCLEAVLAYAATNKDPEVIEVLKRMLRIRVRAIDQFQELNKARINAQS
jgi:hypothetical protein